MPCLFAFAVQPLGKTAASDWDSVCTYDCFPAMFVFLKPVMASEIVSPAEIVLQRSWLCALPCHELAVRFRPCHFGSKARAVNLNRDCKQIFRREPPNTRPRTSLIHLLPGPLRAHLLMSAIKMSSTLTTKQSLKSPLGKASPRDSHQDSLSHVHQSFSQGITYNL